MTKEEWLAKSTRRMMCEVGEGKFECTIDKQIDGIPITAIVTCESPGLTMDKFREMVNVLTGMPRDLMRNPA